MSSYSISLPLVFYCAHAFNPVHRLHLDAWVNLVDIILVTKSLGLLTWFLKFLSKKFVEDWPSIEGMAWILQDVTAVRKNLNDTAGINLFLSLHDFIKENLTIPSDSSPKTPVYVVPKCINGVNLNELCHPTEWIVFLRPAGISSLLLTKDVITDWDIIPIKSG